MLFQNVIPAEVSLVCVVKPDEFWDKKVTHFCFWKEKDRLGFEVSCCPLSCHMTAYFYLFCALEWRGFGICFVILPSPSLQSYGRLL